MVEKPNNYYDTDRLFQECVERSLKSQGSGLVNSLISQQTYQVAWNAFVKWTVAHIQQESAISLPSFGTIGFQTVRDNSKIIYIRLSENFLHQFGLQFQQDIAEKSGFVVGPSFKPNYVSIGKAAGLEKQVVATALANLFALIGELFTEHPNIQVDLGPLGKLSSVDRTVIFQPMAKQKGPVMQGKQTVKALFDMQVGRLKSRDSYKKLSRPQIPGSGALHESFVEGRPPAMSSSGMYKLPPMQREGIKVGRSFVYGQHPLSKAIGTGNSPTRRLNKPRHEGNIVQELLGAGHDPLSRQQDFSLYAADPKKLMEISFKKPPNAQTRFPPVIDAFSRTLAAPVTSHKQYFHIAHKIGANYTPSSRGLYIDPEVRQVRFKKLHTSSTNGQSTKPGQTNLSIVQDSAVSPATEMEEYKAVMGEEEIDIRALKARQESYERYQQYVEHEISTPQIAQIRPYWITHILQLIPADLHAIEKERIEELIDDMLNQVNRDYYNSGRKAILDYILLDPQEMCRLGIQQQFNPPEEFGLIDEDKATIEPDDDWRNSVSNARLIMSEKLCIYTPATLALMKLWTEYEVLSFVDLPAPRSEPYTLLEFLQLQERQMAHVKNKLATEWNKRAVDILRQEIEHMDEQQMATFFSATATLMSNQVRSLIKKSVEEYVAFLQRYNNEHLPSPFEAMEGAYDPHQPLEDSFLTLRLIEQHSQITFESPLLSIKKILIKIIEDVVKQSQNLPRPQNTISRSDKQHLWQVPIDDELVKFATVDCEHVIERNLAALDQVVFIFKDFAFLLDEKKKVEEFVQGNRTRAEYLAEIEKYRETSRRIRRTMPVEVRMSMVRVDCTEINNHLVEECEGLIDTLLKATAESIQDKANNIIKRFEEIRSDLTGKSESADRLVRVEEFIELARTELLVNLNNEFQDLVKWVSMLYTSEIIVPEDIDHQITSCQKWTNDIESFLDTAERAMKIDRGELENKLTRERTAFIEEIADINAEIDAFKEKSDLRQEEKNNKQLVLLQERLAQAGETLEDINKREELLGFGVTEFPKYELATKNIQPFLKLWALLKDYKSKEKSWYHDTIFNLVPDEVDKERKVLYKDALQFKSMHGKALPKPLQIAEHVIKQVTEFNELVPLVRSFCNPGLKERHWKELSEVARYELKNDPSIKLQLLKQLKLQQHIVKIEEISDTAMKEYSNEKILSKMKEEWEPLRFELKDWRDSGKILEGAAVDEIQTYMDDHIMRTQTMKGSPYAKVFLEEIIEWEQWLLYTQEALEVWIKVQAMWLYLEPVFSSEDIMRQMPEEGTKFREVDRVWCDLIDKVDADSLALKVSKIPNLLQTLQDMHSTLEQVQKGLNDYLETKRAAFARFYFLSNDELLEILSETKDPLRVQKHLKKCFEGIDELEFDQEKKIHGMISSEGENVPFTRIIEPAAAKGLVELWLKEVEDVMVQSVHVVVQKCIADHGKRPRNQWVISWPGQAVLNGDMYNWTEESETALKKSGVVGLQNYHEKLNKLMEDIVNLVRGDLDKLARCTLQALIVLDVHNKDVIKSLVQQNIEDINDFMWLAQMRYYWENNDSVVRMINAVLDYNYEYLGNSSRLVITPLTDRCYRTLCGAIHLNYGGAPEGPAGTGKTETVKDLSKALARQCVVFNCSDGLDYLQMAKFFRGLASCGAWSCFDEFNRIELEVLSVIAQQLMQIQRAIELRTPEFLFEGTTIPIKFTCNCFITMNPGYAGRAELPDNLKALFRTVAMMVPDYAMIAEIMLYSFGFLEGRALSGKIVTTYKLCSEQLSSQHHYDYGMRAVKSVLTAAGNLKRKMPNENEHILVLRAINDVNLAKFLSHDIPLFRGIASDLFPGITLPEPDYKDLLAAMKLQFEKYNLQEVDYFVEKVIQLYEMIIVRHGLMVVGLPFAGKSSAIKVLAGALGQLNKEGKMEEKKVQITVINPKSVTMGQLYGNFDEVSHDWNDGVLPVCYRHFADPSDKRDRKWLIFDGPVDAIWIENMNTVLDDNKKLCLMSGEIIQMTDNMNMIFEPMDLDVASPATVSRCGMVYMQPHMMGWSPIFESWKKESVPDTFQEDHIGELNTIINWLVDPCLNYLRDKLVESSPTNDQNLVTSMLRILKTQLAPLDNKEFFSTIENKAVLSIIDSCVLFSMIWSVCASVNTDNRKEFDIFFKKLIRGDIEGINRVKKLDFPDRYPIYEVVYFPKERAWKNWMDLVDKNEAINSNLEPQEIIVTTIDTIRYSFFMELFIHNEIPSLFVGPTGTGKSVYVLNVLLNKLSRQKYITIEIGFSAQTTCNQGQEIIDGKLDKRRKDHFGPKFGMKCVVFVDDLNMPVKEKYGAQPPIEILRQLVGQNGWYDLKDPKHPFRHILDTTLLCAMGEPGGGKSFITPRFWRFFNIIAFSNFDDKTMQKIFKTILGWYLNERAHFSLEIAKMDEKMVTGTLEIYKRFCAEMLPTPTRSHYTFNLRDFSKVIMGVCMVKKEQVASTDVMIRLWTHEVVRVFGDRLVNDDDRFWLLEALKDVVKRCFSSNFDVIFSHLDYNNSGKIDSVEEMRGLLWGDILAPFGMTIRPYEELLDKAKVSECVEGALQQYNLMSDKPMDLVLFSFAIEHLLRISRILKQPGGNALLVGVGGSGRQSLTRLASKISDFDVFQIEISKSYGVPEWRDDIKNLLRMSGGKGKPTVFLFTDTQIKKEGFLEDINNILNTGEVPNLFPSDEKAEVCEMVRNAARSDNKAPDGTPQQLYSYFVERCKRVLHIVLAFSPIGDAFRNRIRNFPSMVNCCTIDWFSQWPTDALESVASKFLKVVEMTDELREKCVEMCIMFHESTHNISKRFLQELRRHYYVTPTSYLELITTFKTLLKEKRIDVNNLIKRYENGYDCLIKTEETVTKMQQYLEDLKPQLIQTSKETDEKMKIVEAQTVEADKVREVVAEERAIVQKAVDQARAISDECQRDLSEAMPALKAAEKAVECISKNDIALLKKLGSPPDDVRMVMAAVCVLFGKDPVKEIDPATQAAKFNYWPTAVLLMGNINFLKNIIDFDRDNIEEKRINKLQKFLEDPKFNVQHLKGVSEVAANLATWVIAMDKFYHINKVVIPKQAKLKVATQKKNEQEAKLAIKEAELKKVEDRVDTLKRDLKITQDKKADLEAQVDDCTKKLDRAQKLIINLGGEKTRWSKTAKDLKVDFEHLTGNVLISSGIIAYSGAFTSVYRSDLTKEWLTVCKEKEIPSSEVIDMQSVLGDPVKIRAWNIAGLPNDSFSIENAIITSKARRWPLNIDPQGQANKWIKNMEKEAGLKIIKLSDGNYLRVLENSIQFGKPVLLENVGEELDPSLEPLLQKQIFKKGSSYNIRLGDSTIEYDMNFKFYITTKLRNPHYLPEISTKVTLLNFMITYEGLTDQLLSIVVAKERPELETEKERLIVEGAQNKDKLAEIEDKILHVLSTTEDVLADSTAIQILTEAKELANEIAKKQEIAEQTEKEIDEARLGYKPVAERTSGLFFCITDLANIDPMYQYSLVFFINLFIQGIQNSKEEIPTSEEDLDGRLESINSYFLYSLYCNICRSLFAKDKLLFSFLLTIKMQELEGKLPFDEYRFLLTGGVSMSQQLPENPASAWLLPKNWGELNRLEDIPAFKGFRASFVKQLDDWKNLYDSSNPQDHKLPDPWEDKVTPLQRLMILRVIRPDKVVPAIMNFVKQSIGQKFIIAPSFNLADVYKDSVSTSPLIFVLSPGSDPLANLMRFAEIKKKQISVVSLGQGQGIKAQNYIKDSLPKGSWVCLQNCHLAVSWMPRLERICEEMSPDPRHTNREFRLWLTSYPSVHFPVAILQNGVKMTNEPPKGLMNNLLGSLQADFISDQQFYNNCTKPLQWKKLLFGLVFFHAVIQERRKFGPLGWNIPYQFNESDLRISVRQLKMFIEEYPEKVPFDALKYLTGECNYGGRVTDDKDRRLILTLLNDYYCDRIFDDGYKFSPSGKFFAPPIGDMENNIEYVKTLPLNPDPEVYGFHSNADITKDLNETNLLFDSVLLTMSNAGGGSGASLEDTVVDVATVILSQVQKPFNIKEAEKKYQVEYSQSMNTVFTQELTRFNVLIKVVRQSLIDIKRAIAGEILFSQQLEAAANSIFDGKVPDMWAAKSYPSLKPLGSYVKDLVERIKFFQNWYDNGIPKVLHISKFYFTQGFLTGALQNFARRYSIPIDEIDFDYEVWDTKTEEEVEQPQDGVVVIGMFLEGTRWDTDLHVLNESNPKVLFEQCPMLWLKPSLISNFSNYPHYNCPLYKTTARRGVLSTTGHSTNFVMFIRLPSNKPQEHWIKRGVALLCQLDD